MASELQRIVDLLGERLQRSVTIDDRQFFVQVYSPDFGPLDEMRLRSLVRRQAPVEVIDWLNGLNIRAATEPFSTPANESLGITSRLCVPLAYQGTKLGYLWIIEGGEALTQMEIEAAVAAGDDAAQAMYREQLLGEFELGHEREFLRDLLSSDATLQLSAAAGLFDEELFTSQSVAVLVLRPTANSEGVDEHQRLAIDAALVHARRQLPTRQAIHLARPDHGVLLVAANARPPKGSDLLSIGRDLHESFSVRGEAGSTPSSAVVGIGERHGTLTGAATSYRQASQAARVAEILPTLGDVVGFGDLGIYRTLAQLPPEELDMSALHPGLSALLSDATAASLVTTLECFLDLAGDVKATSAELNIHRTTLYYRLGKVEQLAGVDLGRGSDRLVLHLGLKLARLARLYP